MVMLCSLSKLKARQVRKFQTQSKLTRVPSLGEPGACLASIHPNSNESHELACRSFYKFPNHTPYSHLKLILTISHQGPLTLQPKFP
jgi:hypothetical protein